MAPDRTLDGFSIEIFGLTILLSHHSSSNSADAHKSLIYYVFFFGVGGDLSIYLGISTSLEAGERHSFYLFIFLSLPVYDYFFFLRSAADTDTRMCAHKTSRKSRL